VKDLLVAERYARALFETARLSRQEAEVDEELSSFAEALTQSRDIENFLNSPYFGPDQKGKFLEKVYQKKTREDHGVFINFLKILLEKHRFGLIHEIREGYKKILDEARGVGMAEIRTAVPLDPGPEQMIVSRLEKIMGYKIQVRKEVDPSLIGGVIVKIRHKVLDGSVKNKIELLKKELTKIRSI
jgi:F-type H+-transporting ATPase subunit delta